MIFIKYVRFLIAGFCLFCLVLPAAAVEPDSFPDSENIVSRDELPDDAVFIDAQILPMSLDDGNTPLAPAGSLKAIMGNLIGQYSPIVVQYRYQTSSSGSYSYVREIQPDYAYVCCMALFGLMVFCLFRLGGAILCRR